MLRRAIRLRPVMLICNFIAYKLNCHLNCFVQNITKLLVSLIDLLGVSASINNYRHFSVSAVVDNYLSNRIGCARCLNRRYRYGVHGMHYQILLQQYSQNCNTYSSVVKNTYSPCYKDACVQISIGNTQWLLRYKGIS